MSYELTYIGLTNRPDEAVCEDSNSMTTTLQRRLHRDPICASCHAKLDPYGLALENYDAIGKWRERFNGEGFRGARAPVLDVSGKRRQTGSTKTMIFGVKHLVAFISKFMVLEPGDVITTGTPPGVALGMKPPQWLKAGDVITLGVDGLGEQKQKVVPFKGKR